MRIVTQPFSFVALLWLASSFVFGRASDPYKITCITTISRTVVADTCSQGLGQISLTHDGIAPFTYEWSHDSTLDGPVAAGLEGGTSYTVIVTDSVGCTDTTQIGVASLNPMQIPASIISVVADTCGVGLGRAEVDLNGIIGGQAPYAFLWDTTANNQTTPVATDLIAGIYEVSIIDNRGCERSVGVEVPNETNGFLANTETFVAGCSGDSTGSAVVRVSGGASINTYEWVALGDSIVLSLDTLLANVPAGNYIVRVNGGAGSGECGFTRVVNIGEPDPLIADLEVFPSTDCGEFDGMAVATPVGGTPPYDISWSSGAVTDTAMDLLAGFYRLFVADTNGCTDTNLFALPSLPGPKFEVEILQEDNCGLNEGIARVRIDTGRGPFQVFWWTVPSQSDTSLFAYNLPRRETGEPYYVAVRTIDSCFDQKPFYMPGNDPLSLEVIDEQDNYCELANGTISIGISGGTQPYRYEWSTSPAVTSSTIVGLEAGTYTVQVLDSFNCDISRTFTLEDELGFALDVETVDETCYGEEDGTASAITEGGRPPFTYEWTSETGPAQRTAVATDLPGGVYNVVVRDAAGCERAAFGEVLARNVIVADFSYLPEDDGPRVLSNATYEFSNTSIGADLYEWDFGDGNTSAAISPVYSYQDTGSYFVQLKAFDSESGCVDSISYGPFDIVSEGIVFIPNAFTPNDDSFNDVFSIKGQLLETFDLRIYSRWGSEMFSSNTPEPGWDGTMPGGRPAPTGIYVYKLIATLNGGIPYEATGTILLVR